MFNIQRWRKVKTIFDDPKSKPYQPNLTKSDFIIEQPTTRSLESQSDRLANFINAFLSNEKRRLIRINQRRCFPIKRRLIPFYNILPITEPVDYLSSLSEVFLYFFIFNTKIVSVMFYDLKKNLIVILKSVLKSVHIFPYLRIYLEKNWNRNEIWDKL